MSKADKIILFVTGIAIIVMAIYVGYDIGSQRSLDQTRKAVHLAELAVKDIKQLKAENALLRTILKVSIPEDNGPLEDGD